MRILFLAPQPFFVERGTPIAVHLAVSALCKLGHQVDLLTFHEGADVSIEGLRHLRISRPPFVRQVPIGLSPSKLLCDLWMAAKAYRLMVEQHYDAIHAVEEAVFLALLAKPFHAAPLVYDMDSLMSDQIVEKWPRLQLLHSVLAWFEHFAVRHSDLILPVCQAIADRTAPFSRSERVHVLPDIALGHERSSTITAVEDLRTTLDISGPLALYVGNLESYQGVDLLLEGLARLDGAERCELVIIGGKQSEISAYQSRAMALGIGGQVHFIGPRPLGLLGQYLSQADILCSPRRKGVNTPMKIYSYMAARRAVLATRILSHTQVLDDSTAFLVPPTAAGIADGLRALARDPDRRRQLGESAALAANERYSSAAYETQLKRAYAVLQMEGS
jgi:glycosyltransferase involved in cell wall biosynthesis